MGLLSKTVVLDQVLAYQYLVHLKYEILKNNIQPENITKLLQKPNNFIQNSQPVKKIIWNDESQSLLTEIPASPDQKNIPVMNTNDHFFIIKILFNPANSSE